MTPTEAQSDGLMVNLFNVDMSAFLVYLPSGFSKVDIKVFRDCVLMSSGGEAVLARMIPSEKGTVR